MIVIKGKIIMSQEMFLLNTLAMGIAVQMLEKETPYSKEEWQVFLQSNAQEQYNQMLLQERETFIKHLVEVVQNNERINSNSNN